MRVIRRAFEVAARTASTSGRITNGDLKLQPYVHHPAIPAADVTQTTRNA